MFHPNNIHVFNLIDWVLMKSEKVRVGVIKGMWRAQYLVYSFTFCFAFQGRCVAFNRWINYLCGVITRWEILAQVLEGCVILKHLFLENPDGHCPQLDTAERVLEILSQSKLSWIGEVFIFLMHYNWMFHFNNIHVFNLIDWVLMKSAKVRVGVIEGMCKSQYLVYSFTFSFAL